MRRELPRVTLSPTLRPRAAEFAALLARAGWQANEAGEPLWIALQGEALPPGVAAVRIPSHGRTPQPGDLLALLELATDAEVLPYDPVAILADYLSGGHEDPTQLDHFGRLAPKANQLVAAGLHRGPLLDEMARLLGRIICQRAGCRLPEPKTWHFCATFDIDSDGLLRPRRWLRTAAETARQIPAAMARFAADSALALARLKPDPHLQLRQLGEQLEGLGVAATFHAQVAKRHRLDSYRLDDQSALANGLRQVLDNGVHEVGLHSSFTTLEGRAASFRRQWQRLKAVLGERVTPVHRAHYLRTLKAADYPRGFVDSSLGFGSLNGFRYGTCHPFAAAGGAIELPPIAMDSTCLYHEGLSADEAFEELRPLMMAAARVGGAFVLVMHPHHFHETVSPGWHALLFDLITEARSEGARFQSLARTARELIDQQRRLESHLRSHPS